MKTSLFPLFLIIAFGALYCAGNDKNAAALKPTEEDRIPIPYEFAELGLFLNDALDSCRSPMSWKPYDDVIVGDTAHHPEVRTYFSTDRPNFHFKGGPFGHVIYALTDSGKIKGLSAAINFRLEDGGPKELAALLDSLPVVAALRHPYVRQQVIDQHYFKRTEDGFEEEIELTVSEEEHAFDRFNYKIRVHPFDKIRYDNW